MDEALAACASPPQRLLLQRVVSSHASRRAAAWRRAGRHAGLALVAGILLGWLLLLSGMGRVPAWLAGLAVAMGWPVWIFLRQVTDAAMLYEQEEWLDFIRREWRSEKRHSTGVAPVLQSVPLDAMILLCAQAFGPGGWESVIGLVETAEFDPDADSWPDKFDALLVVPPGAAALASATTIAKSWGIACFEFSGATDVRSQRLC